MKTALEKAMNRAAKKVRDAAYRQRRRAYWKALKAAEDSPDVQEVTARVEQLSLAQEEARGARRDKEQTLRKQILAIEEQIKALADDPVAERLEKELSRAVDTRNALKDTLHTAIGREFPDLQGAAQWSVSAWKAPQSVLDAMEAARKAVLSSEPSAETASAAGKR